MARYANEEVHRVSAHAPRAKADIEFYPLTAVSEEDGEATWMVVLPNKGRAPEDAPLDHRQMNDCQFRISESNLVQIARQILRRFDPTPEEEMVRSLARIEELLKGNP